MRKNFGGRKIEKKLPIQSAIAAAYKEKQENKSCLLPSKVLEPELLKFAAAEDQDFCCSKKVIFILVLNG